MDDRFSATRYRVSSGIGSLVLFGVIAVAVSGIWRLLQFHDVSEQSDPAGRTIASASGQRVGLSTATLSQITVVASDTTGAELIPASPSQNSSENIDVSSTSWQKPFQSRLWLTRGWTFDGNSMQSADNVMAEATFRRPYRKLMLDMEIEPLQSSHVFGIRFIAPETRSMSCIEFDDGGQAQVQQAEQKTILKRAMNLDWKPGQSVRFIVAATGNRILISWNGHRILSCAQPAEQSGHPFFCSLVSHGSAFRITNLRIEGE